MRKRFSPAFRKQIYDQLDLVLQKSKAPLYAAFDADGTLWDFDLGEGFFHYQIENCDLELPKDPFQHYLDLKKISPPIAYVWLAQINAGKSLSQVRAWANACVTAAQPLPIYEDVRELIQYLQNKNVEIFVVTASIKWAVEPGAALLGIAQDHVLGVQTRVDKGIVTAEPYGEMTWKQGKATALLQATKGVAPIFCAGNTNGDIDLISASSGVQLCLQSSIQGDSLFEAEEDLRKHAALKKWPHHLFK